MSNCTLTDPSFWNDKWEINVLPWHKSTNHDMLEKHFEKLTENRTGLKILFPLCGKEVDLIWVSKLGHHVVGVGFNHLGCEQFFTENDIKNKTTVIGDFKVYTSESGKIKLYNGDFYNFDCNYEGKFDCVQDRGSLVALPAKSRVKYSEHIMNLLKDDFRYLLETFDYEKPYPEHYPGPISQDEIKTLFGSNCHVEFIDEGQFKPIGDTENNMILKSKVHILKPIY